MAPFTHSRHPLARGFSRWHCKFSESRISYRSVHLTCLTSQELGQFGVFHVLHAFPSPSLSLLAHWPIYPIVDHIVLESCCVCPPPKKGEARSQVMKLVLQIPSWSWNRDRSNFSFCERFNLLWVASLRGNWSSGSSMQRRGNGGLNGLNGTINTLRSRLSGFFLLSVSNFPLERRFILQLE